MKEVEGGGDRDRRRSRDLEGVKDHPPHPLTDRHRGDRPTDTHSVGGAEGVAGPGSF